MLKTPVLFILSLLAFLVISGITASASLSAPFLPDLQHLQPEILAESTDSDTFLVILIPSDSYDYDTACVVVIVPNGPKSGCTPFFRYEQLPLGLNPTPDQREAIWDNFIAGRITEDDMNRAMDGDEGALDIALGGSVRTYGSGSSPSTGPSKRDLLQTGNASLYCLTHNSNFKLDEVTGQIASGSAKFAAEVVCEPADWLSMANEIRKGNAHWSMTLAALPLVSRPVARKLGNVMEGAFKWIRRADLEDLRHLDALGNRGGADEMVDIYRAVGPEEFYDTMKKRRFNPAPNGSEMKQFAFELDEAIKFADWDSQYAAIIKAQVPRSQLRNFNISKNIDPFIFKNGVLTVEGTFQLQQFNSLVKKIEHCF